jgi:fibronectin type 3 domain-containing protein
MPAAELLDDCDRLGILVLDENRRLGTNAEPLNELTRLLLRDRNHPSILAWSLGNEEYYIQGSQIAEDLYTPMQNLAHSMDSTRLCTIPINGSYGNPSFAMVEDVVGFNYDITDMASLQQSTPTDKFLGTEVASTLSTRGIYTNNSSADYCSSYDLELNSDQLAETWFPFFHARPWSSGGFIWTGFDYRGEPTPYWWPDINSHFGVMDTCGFSKDNYFYYQANWTIKPVLHIFPHWNWAGREGQPISVWVYGNCDMVELFLNGVSQGQQALLVTNHVAWNVPYAAGTLQAVGYRNGQAVVTNSVQTTGVPVAVALIPDRNTILADGRDVSVVTVAALDSAGRIVPTASNLVTFTVTGGAIIGVGNGNPTSLEADKASQRYLFNGLAQVVVQSTNQPGSISLTASSTGLTSTNITITEAATLPAPAAPVDVAAIATNQQNVISWDVVPAAISYNVKRSTTSGGPYSIIATNIATIGFIDTNVVNLTAYYYVVTAVNANGESVNSVQVSGTPHLPPVPTVPTGVTATRGDTQVTLNWAGASGAASYNVKRGTSSGSYPTVTNVTTTSLVVTGLVNGTMYFFVVSALNTIGESGNSGEVNATPMPFVSGLTANVVSSQVQLQWNAHTGATGYNVKRSLVSGGPYTPISSNQATTSFTDSSVSTCQTYYYVVTMMTGGVEGVPSPEISATVPGILPPQFTSAGVGSPSPAGSATFCGGQYTISGAGGDIWNTSDAFQFVYVYVPISTNCDIRARVVSVQGTSGNAKAGVMIRETLAAGSRHAMADVQSSSGIEFIWRSSTGGSSSSSGAGGTPPNWVRLTRTNNVFTAYYSGDGNSWTQNGFPVTIAMTVGAYIGLPVCSHVNGTLNTSLIDNVSASFLTNAPPVISWLVPTNNSTFIQPKAITLTASATDADGTVTNVAFFNGTTLLGNVARGTGNQYSLTWSNASVGSYTLSARVTDNSGATNTSPAAINLVVQPLTLTLPGTQNNGQFQLTFQGQNGQNYVLETSTNLTAGWTPVWTSAPANGVLMFTNVNATDGSRFYRVRQ